MSQAENCKYNCNNGKIFMEALKQWVSCPKCKGIEKITELFDENNDNNIFEVLKIPPQYRNTPTVTSDLLDGVVLSDCSEESIASMSKFLDKMAQSIYNGNLLMISAYINLPTNVDTLMYVYGIQKLAVEKSVGVVPYISLNSLSALLNTRNNKVDRESKVDGDNNLNYDMGTRVSKIINCDYYDYTTSPLCILDATAQTTSSGWSALADLLSERAKLGLPTFVFGYWSSKNNYSNSALGYLLNESSRLDRLKVFEITKKSRKDSLSMDKNNKFEENKVNHLTQGLKIDGFM